MGEDGAASEKYKVSQAHSPQKSDRVLPVGACFRCKDNIFHRVGVGAKILPNKTGVVGDCRNCGSPPVCGV